MRKGEGAQGRERGGKGREGGGAGGRKRERLEPYTISVDGVCR